MFRFVKSLSGHNTGALERYIVKSGDTITKGDAVALTDGYIVAAGAGVAVLGVAQETVVGDGTKTVEINVDPLAVYEVVADNDTTTTAQAHMGTYHDLIGTTGAQKLDSSSTSTTGQFLAHKLSGTKVQVTINEKQ